MTTLESKISERLAQFAARRSDLPAKKAELNALRVAAAEAGQRRDHASHFALSEQIAALQREVDDIESGTSETEYLLTIVPYVRGYTDASAGGASPRKKKRGAMESFVSVQKTENKGELFNQYRLHVEKDISANVGLSYCDTDYVCARCSTGLVVNDAESCLICPSCGCSRDYMECGEANMSYEQEVSNEVTNYYAYKRINHFSEWLNSIQGREVTDIPAEVIDALKAEFKKHKIRQADQIKPTKVREYLKKLKLTKYYEHVAYITNILNGLPPPRLPPELEQKLRIMFQEIQEPFERFAPSSRKNFLSYSYVLFKMCELLGEDEYLPYFPLLKSAEKLHQQDMIWKKICQHLRWEYFPSV